MRVWLTFLSGFKSLRGLPRFEEVKQGVAMQLMEDEPLLQAAAIKALKPLKLPFLPQEMLDHLARFCDNKTLREELTTFPLARGAEQGVQEKDRPGVIPLLVSVNPAP